MEERLIKMQAGQMFALFALAEALIKEKVIAPDRLISHLEKPSDEAFLSEGGSEGSAALNGLLLFLKKEYGSTAARGAKAN